MRISTSLLPNLCNHDEATYQPAEVAVVIDVLRATSVMATALAAGANEIITAGELQQAKQIGECQPTRPLMCGERNCTLIPGFDLGNSPSEYRPERVGGRQLVLTTTNGTAAIEAVSIASNVIIASFLNLTAVIEALAYHDPIQLICAGTDGFISNDDILLAGAIITGCEHRYQAVIDGDAARLARDFWNLNCPTAQSTGMTSPTSDWLAAALRETRGGRNLMRAGFESDIDLCAQVDTLSVVPRLRSRDPFSFR